MKTNTAGKMNVAWFVVFHLPKGKQINMIALQELTAFKNVATNCFEAFLNWDLSNL